MPCDICSDPCPQSGLSAKSMRHAVQMGFDPFAAGLIPDKLARLVNPDSAADWKQQTLHGLFSDRDWKLCRACWNKIKESAT